MLFGREREIISLEEEQDENDKFTNHLSFFRN